MKTHLNLRTADLEHSVFFYRTLLDAQPAKHLGDYALFITENPGLELALDYDTSVRADDAQHFGVLVDSTQDVDAAIARLERAGIQTDVAREKMCCYAKQTKVWATDPDGRRWEVYTVLEETGEAEEPDDSSCCTV